MCLKTVARQFGTIRSHVAIGLSAGVRQSGAERLNRVPADTMSLRDLYKKHRAPKDPEDSTTQIARLHEAQAWFPLEHAMC